MIRAWWSRRRPQPGVHRSVDEATFLGAQFDVRDARIEGLQDALAEALKERDEERSARLSDVARLQAALAKYAAADLMRAGLLEHMRRPARERDRSAALEPTVVTDGAQFRRPAGPAPATEQWPR